MSAVSTPGAQHAISLLPIIQLGKLSEIFKNYIQKSNKPDTLKPHKMPDRVAH